MLPEAQVKVPVQMMQIRLHRGGYAESMETMERIPRTKEAIYDYFYRASLLGLQPTDSIELKPYPDVWRKGWDRQFIVMLDGSPAAFTDHDIPDSDRIEVLPGVHDGKKLTISARAPGVGIVPILEVHAPPAQRPDLPEQSRVSDMVQHYSIALLLRVYNEKQILNLLLLGELNKAAASILQPEENSSSRRHQQNLNGVAYAKKTLGKYYREDGKYAEALWSEVVLAGGWPVTREGPVKPLSELFNL